MGDGRSVSVLEGDVGVRLSSVALIPKVLAKIRAEESEVLLVAPWWPKREWFLDLVELSLEPPRALPLFHDLLRQNLNGLYHHLPHVLKLHVWRLSLRALKLPASLRRWHKELLSGDSGALL